MELRVRELIDLEIDEAAAALGFQLAEQETEP